jgi:hypothetical protein
VSGAAPATLIVTLHVPKCAGSTVEAHLAHHLGPAGFWSAPKRSRRIPLELMGRKYSADPPQPVSRVRAVSGHFIGRSVEALFPGRAVHRSVLLRDPAALILSWYNFRVMRYRSEGLGGYPFALHLAALPPDPVAHFLLERWCELPWWQLAAMPAAGKVARLDAMLAGFDRVGNIADCDALIADLSARLKIPAEAARENTAEGWRRQVRDARMPVAPVTLSALTERDRADLDRRTRLDCYLWRRWALGEEVEIDPATVAPFLRCELRRPLAEVRRRQLRARR